MKSKIFLLKADLAFFSHKHLATLATHMHTHTYTQYIDCEHLVVLTADININAYSLVRHGRIRNYLIILCFPKSAQHRIDSVPSPFNTI